MRKQIDIFPKIKRYTYSSNIVKYEEKCLLHERLLFKYLKRSINGWSIRNFLLDEKIDNYILYAVTDFTEIVCDDLMHDESFTPGKICDKRALAYLQGYRGWKVINVDKMIDLYETGGIDKIIIMSVLHENEIIDELLYKGILLNDLISIVSILYS